MEKLQIFFFFVTGGSLGEFLLFFSFCSKVVTLYLSPPSCRMRKREVVISWQRCVCVSVEVSGNIHGSTEQHIQSTHAHPLTQSHTPKHHFAQVKARQTTSTKTQRISSGNHYGNTHISIGILCVICAKANFPFGEPWNYKVCVTWEEAAAWLTFRRPQRLLTYLIPLLSKRTSADSRLWLNAYTVTLCTLFCFLNKRTQSCTRK